MPKFGTKNALFGYFWAGVELFRGVLRIISEQYGHKAYPQQKSFWNGI